MHMVQIVNSMQGIRWRGEKNVKNGQNKLCSKSQKNYYIENFTIVI